MHFLLHQLLAVATSLILALPPGSCSAFVRNDRADPVKKVSCCHETAHNRPCSSENYPSMPSVKCCCERDAALPENSVQPTESLDLSLANVANHVPTNVGTLLGSHAAVIAANSGPRLQVLLCVWHC